MPGRPLRAVACLGYIKSALAGSSIRDCCITEKGKRYVQYSTKHKYISLPSRAKTPSATLLITLIASTSSASVSYSLRVKVRYSSNVDFSSSRSSELLSEPLSRPLPRRIRIKERGYSYRCSYRYSYYCHERTSAPRTSNRVVFRAR